MTFLSTLNPALGNYIDCFKRIILKVWYLQNTSADQFFKGNPTAYLTIIRDTTIHFLKSKTNKQTKTLLRLSDT